MASRNPFQRYTEAHWGLAPGHVLKFEGPHYDVYPEDLVEMGKLYQIQYWPSASRRASDKRAVGFSGELATLAFSPESDEKLFPIYPVADAQRVLGLWRPGKPTTDLQELNREVGGRQAKYPFLGMGGRPVRISVQLLGVVEAVAYKTEKKGDGPSTYHHTHGEEGGIQPVLALDSAGRFWMAGGSFAVPRAGISD